MPLATNFYQPMTIFSVIGNEQQLTVRYLPVLSWAFVGLALFGCSDIVRRINDGRQELNAGTVLALAVLLGLALFVMATAGQLVVIRFNRRADQLRLRRYGLHGRATVERQISDLVGLDVRVLRRAQHRLELRFKSGERLPLTPYYVVSFNPNGMGRLSRMLGISPTVLNPGGR